MISLLETIRDKYVDFYFEEHKKKRLDIHGAKRRGKLLESPVLANLRKLRSIEILSGGKLTAIEQELSDLKVCYELTATELKNDAGLPALALCPWRQGKECGGEIG